MAEHDLAEATALMGAGFVKLPASIVNAKGFEAAGNAFATYIFSRHDYWNSLKANTEGLVPYSLRHGYGWRAVKYKHYDKAVPLRDLCDLIGHDSRTHLKHYGTWTSDKDKKDSVRRMMGTLMTANQLCKEFVLCSQIALALAGTVVATIIHDVPTSTGSCLCFFSIVTKIIAHRN